MIDLKKKADWPLESVILSNFCGDRVWQPEIEEKKSSVMMEGQCCPPMSDLLPRTAHVTFPICCWFMLYLLFFILIFIYTMCIIYAFFLYFSHRRNKTSSLFVRKGTEKWTNEPTNRFPATLLYSWRKVKMKFSSRKQSFEAVLVWCLRSRATLPTSVNLTDDIVWVFIWKKADENTQHTIYWCGLKKVQWEINFLPPDSLQS